MKPEGSSYSPGVGNNLKETALLSPKIPVTQAAPADPADPAAPAVPAVPAAPAVPAVPAFPAAPAKIAAPAVPAEPAAPAVPANYFVHESSYVDEGAKIGKGTRIWHFCHVLSGAEIGQNCSLGQNVTVGSRAKIGDGVKIQNNVSVYDDVEIEDHVFCGPAMVFTNVFNPRSEISRKHEYRKTRVKEGATIGANATIICGHIIGRYAFIGAGAVVTRDIPDFALAYGNPARVHGWMCACGIKLAFKKDKTVCQSCGRSYAKSKNRVRMVK